MYRVIKASEDYEDEELQEYVPKRYEVTGDRHYRDTDSPIEAIKLWFQFGSKDPGGACIMCKKRSDAVELCGNATADLLTSLYSKYKCPYKLEYLIQSAQDQVDRGCKYFYETKYGDQVDPFSVG